MHLRPLDAGNSDEIHHYYESFRDSEWAENPDRPMWSEGQLTSHLLEPIAEQVDTVAAFAEDGTLMGGGAVFCPMHDNTSMAYLLLFVAPRYRRQGVGSALATYLVDGASRHGRTTILAEATYGFDRREDHPYRRFAERHGFTPASTEVHRSLDLPVPEEHLQALIEEAALHHRDYRIETFRDDVPDALLPSMCDVVNQLALDAPTGDIEFEPEAVTAQMWRQRQERDKRHGVRRYDTLAIDSTGTVVAVTTIGLPPDDAGKVHQWATIVQRDHRGHRLGLAVKAANLRAVQHEHPDRTSVHTCNAEDNAAMVRINERLGFRPVELLVEFQRKLSASAARADEYDVG